MVVGVCAHVHTTYAGLYVAWWWSPSIPGAVHAIHANVPPATPPKPTQAHDTLAQHRQLQFRELAERGEAVRMETNARILALADERRRRVEALEGVERSEVPGGWV